MRAPLEDLVVQTFRLSSEQELLDAGYLRFEDRLSHKNAQGAFQKKLRPGVFCNIYSYDLRHIIAGKTDLDFQAEVRLWNVQKYCTVELHQRDESLAEIEAFVLMHADLFEARYGPVDHD